MKYNAVVLTALAVAVSIVHATPIQIQARNAPKDPFVDCLRQSYPKFPSEGAPTTQELRACFAQAKPSTKREETQSTLEQDLYVEEANPEPGNNNTNLIQSRGLDILGKLMGVDQKALCQDEYGRKTTLHDEFVWAKDVIKEAESLCNQVAGAIQKSGINKDGGVGYASRGFSNAHDEQSDWLHNGRHLTLTLASEFYPPLGMAIKDIQVFAQGVYSICTEGVKTLMSPQTGCTEEVDWFVTGKGRTEKELAALGGVIGMYFGGAQSNIGNLRIGFSQDDN